MQTLAANYESQVNLVNNNDDDEDENGGSGEKPREEMLMKLASNAADSRFERDIMPE